GTLTFADGETEKTVNIPITDDALVEGPTPETIDITLSNPGGGVALGATTDATVAITDNDDTPPVAPDVSDPRMPTTAIVIDPLASASDDDGDALTLSVLTQPTNGSVVVDDNGTPSDSSDDFLTYTPAEHAYHGGDSF